jgi:16S rRNA pseudouridine516 synthase
MRPSTQKLHHILTHQGLGSRRYCEGLIQAGEVRIQGQLKTDPEERIPTQDLVLEVQGQSFRYQEKIYLMLHKPVGYECSHHPSHHASIYSLLPEPFIRRGIQCVGRLDHDTSGLILLSDNGEFIHAMTSPKKEVGKTYEVTTQDPITEAQCQRLLDGVQLHDDPNLARATQCIKKSECELSLTLTEGRYHQVKRMIAAVGNKVVGLHRSQIGPYLLTEDLPVGSWKLFDIDNRFA